MIIKLFIFSLPLLTYTIFTVGGKDFLFVYFTAGLLIFYLKNDRLLYFPKEARYFLFFFLFLFANVLIHLLWEPLNIKSFTQLLTILLYFICYILMINVFILQKTETLIKYVNIFIFVCVLASLFSFLQLAPSTFPFAMHLFRNYYDYGAVSDFGIIYESSLSPLKLIRVTGFAPEPSIWAPFLAVPLCILLTRLYFGFRFKTLIPFIIIFLSFILSFGKTGWLAFFMSLLIFPLFVIKKKKQRRIYGLLATIMIIISVLTVQFNINVGSELGVAWSRIERFYGMLNAWNMFIDHPLLGVGLGGFFINQEAYSLRSPELHKLITGGGKYPYNYYLFLLAETGIGGLLLWLLFLYLHWIKLYNFYIAYSDSLKSEYKIFLIGLAVSFMSISFSLINITGLNFTMYMWFIFAILNSFLKVLERQFVVRKPKEAA